MEGSRVPSHPREQLPRQRLSQIYTKLHNYRAKTYGIWLKARVTLCLGPDRARNPIPTQALSCPRRYQAPFCLRDLPQPWILTVPKSLLCWEDSGHTLLHASKNSNSSNQSFWGTVYRAGSPAP